MIRQLVAAEPVARPTDVAAAVEYLSRVQKRRVVAFLISDFLPVGHQAAGGDRSQEDSREHRALAVCNQRHDLIAVTVADPREQVLPDVGFLSLLDAENGRIVEVDTRHPQVRALFQSRAAERSQRLSEKLRRARVDELAIRTDEEYLTSLRRFFHMRERRFR